MKILTYYFFPVLFVVFIFSNQILAQENTQPTYISLYGGIAFPQGDFGSTAAFKDGFASIGFCAMIEYSHFLNDRIKWTSSASVTINNHDDNSMEDNLFPGWTITSESDYFTTWAMTGIGFETIVSPTLRIYGLGQIGFLVSVIPDIKVSDFVGEIASIKNETGTAFAFGFGCGLIINKINLGIRYYSGKPEYEQKEFITDHPPEITKIKKSVTTLQLLIGFNL